MPASACAPGKYPDLQAECLITVMVVATDFHRTSLSSSKLEPGALKCEIVARNADMFSIARKMACVNVRRRGLFLMAFFIYLAVDSGYSPARQGRSRRFL